jgi:hypothetical protein
VVEGLDIVESRRRLVLLVTVLAAAIGIAATVLVPDLVPPSPLVGAAVGLAAVLLGLAAGVAADATDLRVRGPRHVGAAGGELVAVLPVEEDAHAADQLAAAVLEAREQGRPLLLGLAASGLDPVATVGWTDALGLAVARTGVSVLRVDLASGRTARPGLAEVEAGTRKLTDVVDFAPGLKLARTGVGDDQRGALRALTALPPKLPRDLDVLLVALPMAASRGVVQAARVLDHVLIVVERGRTSRVDLIAGLDALDAADLQAQVVLLDDRTAARLASPQHAAPALGEPLGEPAAEAPVAEGPVAEEPPSAEELVAEADGLPRAEDVADADAVAEESSDHPIAAEAEPASAEAEAEPAPAEAEAEPAPAEAEAEDEPVPSTEGPIVAAPVVEAPVAEAPVVEEPAAEGPVAEEAERSVAEPAQAPGPRDVAVVAGAVTAAAADLADQDALHPTPAPVDEPVGGAAEGDEDDDEGDEDDATDRLPRVEARRSEGEGQQDLLRTTAQLAILIDDLDQRDTP